MNAQEALEILKLGNAIPLDKKIECLNIIEEELKEYEGAKNHIEALHKERVENSLKLKALEIIKNKEVDIKAFNDLSNLEEFNYYCEPELTQEEYNLLRRVLK